MSSYRSVKCPNLYIYANIRVPCLLAETNAPRFLQRNSDSDHHIHLQVLVEIAARKKLWNITIFRREEYLRCRQITN